MMTSSTKMVEAAEHMPTSVQSLDECIQTALIETYSYICADEWRSYYGRLEEDYAQIVQNRMLTSEPAFSQYATYSRSALY